MVERCGPVSLEDSGRQNDRNTSVLFHMLDFQIMEKSQLFQHVCLQVFITKYGLYLCSSTAR